MRINICFNSIYSGEEITKVQEKGCNVKMTPTDIQLYGKKNKWHKLTIARELQAESGN